MEIYLILRVGLFATVGGVAITSIFGYAWHLLAEHHGLFGEWARYSHWIHHEVYYPPENLRPKEFTTYKSSGAISWYVMAGILISSIYVVALTVKFFTIADATALVLGGSLYGWFVINHFHNVFHLPSHQLHKRKWFQRLMRLHYIHHWKHSNFGIATFEIDRLFGTYSTELPGEKEEIFPGLQRAEFINKLKASKKAPIT